MWEHSFVNRWHKKEKPYESIICFFVQHININKYIYIRVPFSKNIYVFFIEPFPLLFIAFTHCIYSLRFIWDLHSSQFCELHKFLGFSAGDRWKNYKLKINYFRVWRSEDSSAVAFEFLFPVHFLEGIAQLHRDKSRLAAHTKKQALVSFFHTAVTSGIIWHIYFCLEIN